jgi:hypothetical protein
MKPKLNNIPPSSSSSSSSSRQIPECIFGTDFGFCQSQNVHNLYSSHIPVYITGFRDLQRWAENWGASEKGCKMYNSKWGRILSSRDSLDLNLYTKQLAGSALWSSLSKSGNELSWRRDRIELILQTKNIVELQWRGSYNWGSHDDQSVV